MCAQNDRPAGVVFRFHVCEYSIEPPHANRALNLLSKDDCRAALADEVEHGWPEVAVVLVPFALARGRERLAGTRARPNRSVCWPSGKLQGKGPSADTAEVMDLGVWS
jgi:hypothetical protein